MAFLKRKDLFYIQKRDYVSRIWYKIKGAKTLKIKYKIQFIDRLKITKHAMRFFLLLINCLLFYPGS